MRGVIGWDIGGVHTKAVRMRGRDLASSDAVSRSFEIWHEPEKLSLLLRDTAEELGLEEVEAMAVTMTAELSDAFRTKREGVLFVIDAVTSAFPRLPSYFLSLAGDFASPAEARLQPLDFAAANWLAGALFVAARHRDCIFIDVGSTTTDIIPIQRGRVVNQGSTDSERLISGELVYTGVVRTNPNTLTARAPLRGRMCRLAAEHFAVMGDVHLLLDLLAPQDYSTPTPDGRARSRRAAGERLARLVCADSELLSREQVRKLAQYLHEKQLQQLSEALLQVLSRVEGGYHLPLAPVGLGGFLALEVGRRLGLPCIDLGESLGRKIIAVLPSAAVAYLLSDYLEGKAHR